MLKCPPIKSSRSTAQAGCARWVGEMREIYGDGNYAGRYQRSDEEMTAIWECAVSETRVLLEKNWD